MLYCVRYLLVRIRVAKYFHEQRQTVVDAKLYSRLNKRLRREYIVFAAAQFLRIWYEQRPINDGDLDSNVTGQVDSVARG